MNMKYLKLIILIFIAVCYNNGMKGQENIRLLVESFDDGNDLNNIKVRMKSYSNIEPQLGLGAFISFKLDQSFFVGQVCPANPSSVVTGIFKLEGFNPQSASWVVARESTSQDPIDGFCYFHAYRSPEIDNNFVVGDEFDLFYMKISPDVSLTEFIFFEGVESLFGTALQDATGTNYFDGYDLIALPITLTRFDAVWNKEGWVDLVWETESETNADGFVVERSLDGRKWEAIDKLSARGSVDSRAEYRTKDLKPEAGYNYYRLKMLDLDGTFEYSPLRSVFSLVRDRGLTTYPNPVDRELFITTDRLLEDVRMEIFSMTGESVYFERMDYLAQNASTSILLPQLASGAYNVVVSQKNGEVVFTDVLIKK